MRPKSPTHPTRFAQLALLALAACSSSSTTHPTERSAAPPGDAVAAAPSSVAGLPPPIASAAPPPTASAAPPPTASAAPPPAASPASAAPASTDPLPRVKVANIGMHVGGGPYDAVTKEPIRRSVEPHFDAFRRCFARVTDQEKGGDFGVDLRIPKDGGKAEVTKPRTTLKGDGFARCVLDVFEGVDFLKPKGGLTVVSYSLRFTP